MSDFFDTNFEDRHSNPDFHRFGEAFLLPSLPQPIGNSLSEGNAQGPARSDHVHTLLAGSLPSLIPWGYIGSVEATSNQTGITAVTDLTSLSITWTAVSTRRYKFSWCVPVVSTTADGVLTILLTNSSNTQQRETSSPQPGYSNQNNHITGFHIVSGLSGSTTWKLRGVKTVGGSMTINASATSPATFLLEDIGPV